jgi:hypothetical protein
VEEVKFGEVIKLVFDAHYEDLASKPERCTRYTRDTLAMAVKSIPWQWKKAALMEFNVIVFALKQNILSCTHKEIETLYPGGEQCKQCKCYRMLELEDQNPNSYNDRKIWSEWKI